MHTLRTMLCKSQNQRPLCLSNRLGTRLRCKLNARLAFMSCTCHMRMPKLCLGPLLMHAFLLGVRMHSKLASPLRQSVHIMRTLPEAMHMCFLPAHLQLGVQLPNNNDTSSTRASYRKRKQAMTSQASSGFRIISTRSLGIPDGGSLKSAK